MREKPEPDPRLCRASGADPHRQQAIRVVLGINASSALPLDITGARWGLAGAEAILKLRALRSNGDFDEYFRFHLTQERRRNHQTRYADAAIPIAA